MQINVLKNKINELGFYPHKLRAYFKYFICRIYRFDINKVIPKFITYALLSKS